MYPSKQMIFGRRQHNSLLFSFNTFTFCFEAFRFSENVKSYCNWVFRQDLPINIDVFSILIEFLTINDLDSGGLPELVFTQRPGGLDPDSETVRALY